MSVHDTPLAQSIHQTSSPLRLLPPTLNKVQGAQEVRKRCFRILSQWKMTKILHSVKDSAGNLISSGFTGFGRTAVVVFTCQHVYRAECGVDLLDSAAAIPATKVEFEVASEYVDTLRLFVSNLEVNGLDMDSGGSST